MPAKFLGIWIWLRLKAYENRIDEETTVKLKSLLAILLTIGFSASALAQHNHGTTGGQGGTREPDARPMEKARLFNGEVRQVNKDGSTVTLKHESIDALDVPATTMAYPVNDASILDHLHPGDRVRFLIVRQGRALLITNIVPAQ
ncbi:copper-binding protein [Aquabacterium commune]|uniref:copper-binding protein n=1 Tax=Aquabacterium commune TaxID=70586 RepID=UPI00105D067C|nr:copper-binding protein [Aquabacterium commune]